MNAAAPDRFRPTRCGIINLWDYRDEEFVFADGRMVLRGPNGSGKTKALEVLFPFVFDGRIEPRRLNPFAGEERTMKSNLLYRGQESSYAYVWMEFRRDEPQEAVTVGVGLRAQKQADRPTRWHFVVDGQVGRDFSLIGPDDRPLTRKQLIEQIGADRVLDRPVEHRAAVDRRLFGLGLERFEQLLTLILTLRRPQLAKDLDPKGLSRALSDGLRPLDQALIDEAAHSFSDMESVQRTLAGLIAADGAANAFLSGYATYVRTHARAAADRLAERLVEASQAHAKFTAALTQQRISAQARKEAERERHEAEETRSRAFARLDSLKASPAYQNREQLNRLAQVTADLERAAARDRAAVARFVAHLERRETELHAARDRHQAALDAVHRVAAEVLEVAAEAGIEWQPADNADDIALLERATARATVREDDVAAVRRLLAAVDEARRFADRAGQTAASAEQNVTKSRTAVEAAETALVSARRELIAAVAEWAERQRWLLDRLLDGDVESLLAALSTAAADLTTESSTLIELFAAQMDRPSQAHRDELARQRVVHSDLVDHLARLREQRTTIAEEKDQAPPAFSARTDTRDGRPGAAFWAVVDFADHVDESAAAALEAALEAANLLDAFVSADSGVDTVDSESSETLLVPLPKNQRPKGVTLANYLIADPGPVPEERILAVLASVSVNERPPLEHRGLQAVSTQGRFWQGIAIGAHHKPHAEYIGATARARRRLARLAELDRSITAAELAAAQASAQIEVLIDILDRVRVAGQDLPAPSAVFAALREVDRAAAALRQVSEHADWARAEHDQAVAAVGAADRALTQTAAARAMPVDRQGVDQVNGLIVLFVRQTHELNSHRRTAATRNEQLQAAGFEVDQARESMMSSSEQAELSESNYRDRAEELATLRGNVGADAEAVEREITQTTESAAVASAVVKKAQGAVEAAVREAGRWEGRVQGAGEAVRKAVVEAQHDSHRLAPFGRTALRDVLRLADTATGWPTETEQWPQPDDVLRWAGELTDPSPSEPTVLPEDVVRLHRAILTATADLRPTESSLKSSRTRVSASLAELQNELAAAGHDYRPEWEAEDDIIVVRVADEQGFSSIGDFARRIGQARRDQELLLTESERRVLEDALLARLAQQIHERTTDARDLISGMNTEMRSRRMSSGATVGIGWELADTLDVDRRAVSRLLDRDAARLSTADLAQMRAQFSSQIKDLRAARPDRPYAEILADALDYRQWRSFVLTLVGPDGREDRLTTARHSTLSGGEQSASVHLPLFAAAHVMLSSAAPHCPRLLALDEAFAGIDDRGRSELFELTAQFDLDLFMTGYDLWASYATVPACAHHDLAHSAVEHTVSALLLLWNGGEILTDGQINGHGEDLAATLGSPGTRRVPEDVPDSLADDLVETT